MQIKDVLAQQNATLENVQVVSMQEPRQFEKFGKVTKVCNGTIKDDSGEMQLTLWNDEIDSVQEGDTISIIDGWVKEWQGNMQISAGRNGKIVKAGESAPAEEPKAPEEAPAEEAVAEPEAEASEEPAAEETVPETEEAEPEENKEEATEDVQEEIKDEEE